MNLGCPCAWAVLLAQASKTPASRGLWIASGSLMAAFFPWWVNVRV